MFTAIVIAACVVAFVVIVVIIKNIFKGAKEVSVAMKNIENGSAIPATVAVKKVEELKKVLSKLVKKGIDVELQNQIKEELAKLMDPATYAVFIARLSKEPFMIKIGNWLMKAGFIVLGFSIRTFCQIDRGISSMINAMIAKMGTTWTCVIVFGVIVAILVTVILLRKTIGVAWLVIAIVIDLIFCFFVLRALGVFVGKKAE